MNEIVWAVKEGMQQNQERDDQWRADMEGLMIERTNFPLAENHGAFAVLGPAGSGKTHLYRKLLHYVTCKISRLHVNQTLTIQMEKEIGHVRKPYSELGTPRTKS